MKKYFYCQSYQAFNLALSMNLNDEVIVITAAKNIIKACETLGVSFISQMPISINDIYFKSNKTKHELKRIVDIINGDELHFTHTQYAVFCFLLVSEYNKKYNKTIFHNIEYKYGKGKLNIVEYYHFLKIKWIAFRYGIDLEYRSLQNSKYIFSLPVQYIKDNCNISDIDSFLYVKKTVQLYKNHDFKIPQLDADIFIDQGLINDKIFDQNQVFQFLNILRKRKIYIKLHPIHGRIFDIHQNFIYLNECLPVELYLKNFSGIIVSPYSTTLNLAAYFDKIKFIAVPFLLIDKVLEEKIKTNFLKEEIVICNSIDDFEKEYLCLNGLVK